MALLLLALLTLRSARREHLQAIQLAIDSKRANWQRIRMKIKKSTAKNLRDLPKIQPGKKNFSHHSNYRRQTQRNSHKTIGKKSTYLISSLNHSLLPLQLNVLLFLGISERPRHTEEESAGAKNPQSLSAEHDARLRERGECGHGASDLTAGAGGNHVFEGGDTLVEGLAFDLGI